ncbi:hypothetical protein KSP39_PZI005976 [Platanthera zijinensis]|uniref:Uncharacterized protein n=1 Tax=Platanthera zijinensis TaxID=2320716 RepID=A0AAP0GAZ4_9ASPA
MMEKRSSYGQEDIVNLKLQLEAGQVKLLSRLEEEEQEKAALMGRIQRLTKLILVSTKNTLSSNVTGMVVHRRRHSFGEDELAYLPDRKRECAIDDDVTSFDSELSGEGRCGVSLDSLKFDKKNRKRGMLGWFKSKKSDHLHGLSPNVDYESSANGSPLQVSQHQMIFSDITDGQKNSVNQKGDDLSLIVNYFSEKTKAGDLFSATANGRQPPPTGTTILDEMDLLSEQVKLLAGELALCTSSLKRLAEQASNNPEDPNIQDQMHSLTDDINVKKVQMRVLEQRMIGSLDDAPLSLSSIKMSQALSKITTQLSEKTFEHEIMSADNRILQEQLQMKMSENTSLQETIKTLNAQINYCLGKIQENGHSVCKNSLVNSFIENESEGMSKDSSLKEIISISMNEESIVDISELPLRSQVLTQSAEIENLKQKNERLEEEKKFLQIHCQELIEEASYARELAAAAAEELKNITEEITKLSYENSKLTDGLTAFKQTIAGGVAKFHRQVVFDENNADDYFKKSEDNALLEELRNQLLIRSERESSLEAALSMTVQREHGLQKHYDDVKQREQDLENELANMWVTVAKLKKNDMVPEEIMPEGFGELAFHPLRSGSSIGNGCSGVRSKGSDCLHEHQITSFEDIRSAFDYERKRCKELQVVISKLKAEDLSGLDVKALEVMQDFHVEALSKICQEKLKNRTQLNQDDGSVD